MNENNLKLKSPKLSPLKSSSIYKNNFFSPSQSSILNIDINKFNNNSNLFLNINSSNISLKTDNTKTQFPEEFKFKTKKYNFNNNKIGINSSFWTNCSIRSPIKVKKKYQIGYKLNNNLKKDFHCKCNNFNKILKDNFCSLCRKKYLYYKKIKSKKSCSCINKKYKGICCKKNINELKKLNTININKNNVVQNIFFKNERYFYSNKINFQEILKKIYYENYKLKDLKEYILPSFKKIKTPQSFFELLFIEAKLFGDSVRNLLIKEIKKLNLKNDNYVESFNLNPNKVIKTINLLYKYYKNWENINFEIEKLTKIYLENFLEKKKPFSFDTFLFHRKMFINRVYNESIIHDFIIFINKIFKNNNFNQNNYKQPLNKIYEIYETLEQISIEFSNNLSKDKINNNIIKEENNILNFNWKSENESDKIIIKKKKKKKTKKKIIIQNDNIIEEDEENEKDDEEFLKWQSIISLNKNNENLSKKVTIFLSKNDINFYKKRILIN